MSANSEHRDVIRGTIAGLYFERLPARAGGTEGPPIVLLPGLRSDGRQLKRVARGLARDVVVIDPLGSGRSTAPADAAEYALPLQVPRLLAVLDELAIAQCDLVGVSMGGMWAQHALVRAPERIRAACLVGTCARVSPRLRSVVLGLHAMYASGVAPLDLFRVLQALLFSADFLEQPSVTPLLELLASDVPIPTSVELAQLDALLAHDLLSELTRVRSVRLVLAGTHDTLMPRRTQLELAEALGLPSPQLIPDAGHALWIEQPAVLAQALATALTR